VVSVNDHVSLIIKIPNPVTVADEINKLNLYNTILLSAEKSATINF